MYLPQLLLLCFANCCDAMLFDTSCSNHSTHRRSRETRGRETEDKSRGRETERGRSRTHEPTATRREKKRKRRRKGETDGGGTQGYKRALGTQTMNNHNEQQPASNTNDTRLETTTANIMFAHTRAQNTRHDNTRRDGRDPEKRDRFNGEKAPCIYDTHGGCG